MQWVCAERLTQQIQVVQALYIPKKGLSLARLQDSKFLNTLIIIPVKTIFVYLRPCPTPHSLCSRGDLRWGFWTSQYLLTSKEARELSSGQSATPMWLTTNNPGHRDWGDLPWLAVLHVISVHGTPPGEDNCRLAPGFPYSLHCVPFSIADSDLHSFTVINRKPQHNFNLWVFIASHWKWEWNWGSLNTGL